MSVTAYLPATRAPAREETAPEPPRRPKGPVLMADLLLAPNGRPLLLAHWDREGDRG